MRTFENQSNGYQEVMSEPAAVALVVFFGPIYLAVKGLWAHAAIWLAVAVGCVLVLPQLLLFAVPMLCIGYGIAINPLIAQRYLRMGWREV
jgi:hypothetical protein